MKKLASILMTGLLLLAPMHSVHAYEEGKMQNVTLNGVRQDVTPIVQNGTTILPVATVAKLVGYSGTWNNKTKSGTLKKDSVKVAFKLGSKSLKLTKNGTKKTISMLEPVKVIKGRTYLPLRAVGETLGMEVGYNGTTKEISLKTGNETATETPKQPSEKIKIGYENLTMDGSMDGWQFDIRYPLNPNKPEDNNTKPEEPATPSEPEQTQAKIYSNEEVVQETFRLLNEERKSLGLNELKMRDDLNNFARSKSNYLVEHDMYKIEGITGEERHCPNGKSLIKQLKEHNISNIRSCGENLTTFDRMDKACAFKNWQSSPGHHENMIDPKYEFVGIGIADKNLDGIDGLDGHGVATMILLKEKK